MSDSKPEGTSKAGVRIAVGAIYFIVIVGCLFAGITATSLIVSVMACMCCWEFLRLCHGAGRLPNDGIALLVSALYPLAPLLNYGNVHLLATMVLLVALAVWYVAVPRVTISDVALTAIVDSPSLRSASSVPAILEPKVPSSPLASWAPSGSMTPARTLSAPSMDTPSLLPASHPTRASRDSGAASWDAFSSGWYWPSCTYAASAC